MRVEKVTVTYERKLNTGNYSSATLGLTLWVDLDRDESEAEVVPLLQEQARELVRAEYGRLSAATPSPAVQTTTTTTTSSSD